MTMLGRILAQQVSYDLSVFADGGQVSDWASTYVQTLVAQGVITGNGGYLMPQSEMTRGEMAKVITLVSQLAHAELTPRGGCLLYTSYLRGTWWIWTPPASGTTSPWPWGLSLIHIWWMISKRLFCFAMFKTSFLLGS